MNRQLFQKNALIPYSTALLCLLYLSTGLHGRTLYRPFDDYIPGARFSGLAGTAVSYPDDLSAAFYNPAWFALENREYMNFTGDVQANLQGIIRRERFKVLSLPLAGANFDGGKNWGWAVTNTIPFQRKLPANEDFSVYFTSASFGYSLNNNWHIGTSIGALTSVEQGDFFAHTWGTSTGLLYVHDGWHRFTAGLSLFFSGEGRYGTFRDGSAVREALPSRLQAGFSYLFARNWRGRAEFHITDWNGSRFTEETADGDRNRSPNFSSGFNHDTHLHVSLEMPFPFFSEAWFRTGVQTASYFDYRGQNERQVHLTFGFGAIAGGESKKVKKGKETYLFEDRLSIDISLVDSLLLEPLLPENNLIEMIQVSAVYRFSSYALPPAKLLKTARKAQKRRRRLNKKRKMQTLTGQPGSTQRQNNPKEKRPDDIIVDDNNQSPAERTGDTETGSESEENAGPEKKSDLFYPEEEVDRPSRGWQQP